MVLWGSVHLYHKKDIFKLIQSSSWANISSFISKMSVPETFKLCLHIEIALTKTLNDKVWRARGLSQFLSSFDVLGK